MEGRARLSQQCLTLRAAVTIAAGLCGCSAHAIDYRFDVATAAFTADNTSWFSSQHLPALSFPSVNGHDIEQSALNNTYQNTITGSGNSLGIYYNDFNLRFGAGDSAATTVSTVNSFCTSRFGADAANRWLVLNEVDAATWNGTSGNAYRTWLVDTMKGLHDAGYNNIILWTPRYLASKTYQSSWKSIATYAYLGLETYQDGLTIKNNNFSLSKTQAYYQGYYDSWTSATAGAGVAAARLFAGEHFSVNTYDSTHYWGANGISGADWQRAIQIRDIAIHNIPFGGFIGYAWQRDDQATGDDATDLAAQLSYERAYAATMVVQSEVPTWTGNGGVNNSWTDGFNWTGGLPSTTQNPYPLLAASNPTLPKQASANFFDTIRANTTVTLDGNQSVTKLAFDSPYAYTISAGTGGTLSLSGTGATVDVKSGAHAITANLALTGATTASASGGAALTISGGVSGAGSLTKTGGGTISLLGTNSFTGGTIVSAGKLVVSRLHSANAVTINGGTLQVADSAPTLPSYPAGNNAFVSRPSSLTVANNGAALGVRVYSGTLDLGNNDLIIDYSSGTSPRASIEDMVRSGFNLGNWLGTGITSSTAANPLANGNYALGVAENASLVNPFGNGTTTGPLFDGQSVDSTTVLVKFTHRVDLDLNGFVDGNDAAVFNGAFNAGAATGAVWTTGDVDYDGKWTSNDAAIFNSFYDESLASLPEPGFAAVLAFIGVATLSLQRVRAVRHRPAGA